MIKKQKKKSEKHHHSKLPQITKYLGVTLTKVKGLFDKNFMSLKKEIEEDTRKISYDLGYAGST